MRALLNVFLFALDFYWFVIIASAIFSWLYAFGVINPRNQFISTVGTMLYQLTEPALRPIRRYIPSFGGLDLSPLVLLLLLLLIQQVIILYIYPYVP